MAMGDNMSAPYFAKKGMKGPPAGAKAAMAKGAVNTNVKKTTTAKFSKKSTSGHAGAGAPAKAGTTRAVVKGNPFAKGGAFKKKGGR